jgi:hypothetical protein
MKSIVTIFDVQFIGPSKSLNIIFANAPTVSDNMYLSTKIATSSSIVILSSLALEYPSERGCKGTRLYKLWMIPIRMIMLDGSSSGNRTSAFLPECNAIPSAKHEFCSMVRKGLDTRVRCLEETWRWYSVGSGFQDVPAVSRS